MGPIGIPELIFIFILALLIFGPKKLPELARNVGKGLQEFRRASSELRNAVEDEMRTLERETQEVTKSVEESISRAVDSGEGSAGPAEEPPYDPELPHDFRGSNHGGTQGTESGSDPASSAASDADASHAAGKHPAPELEHQTPQSAGDPETSGAGAIK